MSDEVLLVLRVLISGDLVVLVNVVAKREPGLAGLIVAFPVITLVVQRAAVSSLASAQRIAAGSRRAWRPKPSRTASAPSSRIASPRRNV